MNRYLIFGYDQYYPSGGLSDLIGDFDVLQDAITKAITSSFEYVYIYDQEDDEFVWENDE